MATNPSGLVTGQTLAEYVRSVWGTEVHLVPKQTVAVLTTPTRVLKNNPRRLEAMIVNRGTGQVDLDWNPSAALGDGIPLGSLASLNLTAFEDGELVGYELFAISSAAGNNLAVYEVEST